MTREQQLEQSLAIVKDNLDKLVDFIDEARLMESFDKQTKDTNSAWTYILNMETACDLKQLTN